MVSASDIVRKDLEHEGYTVTPGIRASYCDLTARSGDVTLLVSVQGERKLNEREIEKLKRMAEHMGGRAAIAEVKRFLGRFGLKVKYTIL